MKVVLAAGSRFHSFHLAQQLKKRELLYRIFTLSAQSRDFQNLGKDIVAQNALISFADRLYGRLRGDCFLSKGRWYQLKDSYFDSWLQMRLELLDPFDIFVGWAHYWLESSAAIKSKGAHIVLEAGSFHLLKHFELIEEEYQRLGLPLVARSVANTKKILAEYNAADYIVVPAQHIKKSFLEYGHDERRIVVAPCGVKIDQFSLKSGLELPSKFRVLFVGPLSIHKGVHYLLEAWNKLSFPRNQVELVLVGPLDAEFKKVLKSISLKSNVSIVPGVAQEKLPQIYAQASLFVLPSLEDGFGMVATEAMASGVPVLCTENCGVADLIYERESGFVVPIRDADALARYIEWGYQNRDSLHEMGRQARRVVEGYSWDRYGDQMVQFYESIVSNKAKIVNDDISKSFGSLNQET